MPGPPPPGPGAAAAEIGDVDVRFAVRVARDEPAAAVELEGDGAPVAGDGGREGVVAGAEPGARALAHAPGRAVLRSWTKTSTTLSVSPGVRVESSDAKATKRPSAEIDGWIAWALPSARRSRR